MLIGVITHSPSGTLTQPAHITAKFAAHFYEKIGIPDRRQAHRYRVHKQHAVVPHQALEDVVLRVRMVVPPVLAAKANNGLAAKRVVGGPRARRMVVLDPTGGVRKQWNSFLTNPLNKGIAQFGLSGEFLLRFGTSSSSAQVIRVVTRVGTAALPQTRTLSAGTVAP